MKQPFSKDILFLTLLTILVACAGLYGVMKLPEIYGQRNNQFDHKRVVDLATIQNTLDQATQQGAALPTSLTDLPQMYQSAYGMTSDSLALNDPQTHTPYTYKKINDTSYQLCATFATDTLNGKDITSPTEYDYATYQYAFKHPRGNYCYNLQVYSVLDDQSNNEPGGGGNAGGPTPTITCLGACPTEEVPTATPVLVPATKPASSSGTAL